MQTKRTSVVPFLPRPFFPSVIQFKIVSNIYIHITKTGRKVKVDLVLGVSCRLTHFSSRFAPIWTQFDPRDKSTAMVFSRQKFSLFLSNKDKAASSSYSRHTRQCGFNRTDIICIRPDISQKSMGCLSCLLVEYVRIYIQQNDHLRSS